MQLKSSTFGAWRALLACAVLASCQSLPASIVQRAFLLDSYRSIAPGIQVAHVEGENVSVWVAQIDLNEPRSRVELYYQPQGATVSQTARRERLALAVNAGPYVKDSLFRPWSVFKTRTGALFGEAKSSSYALVERKDGRWDIVSASQALATDELVCGGYSLLLDGGRVVESELAGAQAREPRTAVGLDESQTRLFLLVADGRRWGVPGLTLAETSLWLKAAGASKAVNLDGGGSSTLVFETEGELRVANVPQGVPVAGGERAVATVLGCARVEESVR